MSDTPDPSVITDPNTNESITLEQWLALGYGPDGHKTRNLTDDPIGLHPHAKPGST
jgi:hypothetical protein